MDVDLNIFDQFNNDTFGNITDNNSTIFNDTIDGNITGNGTAIAADTPLDPWLLAMVIIFPVLILFFSFVILVNMQHPDDRSAAYFPKFVVVVGLSLAQITVLMFPLDVANQSGQLGCGSWNTLCGGLDMSLAWQTVFVMIVVMVVVVIPFSIFFYEAYIPGKNIMNQFCEAMQYQVGVIIIFGIAFGLMSRYLSTAYIPINTIKIDDTFFATCQVMRDPSSPLYDTSLIQSACTPQGLIMADRDTNHTFNDGTWEGLVNTQEGRGDKLVMSVSFVVFMTCFISFIGWFAFSLFVGVGFIVAPVDLVRDFIYRPQYMPKSAYLFVRDDIQKRVTDAISMLNSIKGERKTMHSKKWGERRRISSKTRQAVKKIKAEIVSLESEYEELVLCHEQWKSYNPLVPFAELIMGILGAIISVLWLVHIVLYMFIRYPYPDGYPLSYFLNDMLSWGMKEINFALLGVLFLGIFAFHLLFCVIKGNFKIGVRFFIFEVHPMKYHGTYMNSFLVNTSLILLTTPALVMFCSQAFANFVVLTEIQVLGAQVRYMEFFRYFFQYNAFVALILFLSFITFVYIYTYPNDKQAQAAKKLKATISKFEGLEDKRNLEAVEEKKKARKLGVTLSSSKKGNESQSLGGTGVSMKGISGKSSQDIALV